MTDKKDGGIVPEPPPRPIEEELQKSTQTGLSSPEKKTTEGGVEKETKGKWKNVICPVFILLALAVCCFLWAMYVSLKEQGDGNTKSIKEQDNKISMMQVGSQQVSDKLDNLAVTVKNTCGPVAVVLASIVSTPKKKVVVKKAIVPKVVIPKAQKQYLPAPSPASVVPSVSVSAGSPSIILLWSYPEATASNPKPCIISSGNGAGLPPKCSSFTILEIQNGETRDGWTIRAGSRFGNTERPTSLGLYHKN